MEAKFTKGDWYWVWDSCDCEYPCNCSDHATSLRSRMGDGKTTPVIYSVEDMNNHDAHLITAAPEMYKMLEEIEHNFKVGNSDHSDINDGMIPRLEKLLAKARDES